MIKRFTFVLAVLLCVARAMATSYNFDDEKLLKFGRFDLTHDAGASPGLAGNGSGIEFVLNDTGFTCHCAVVSGVSGAGFQYYVNGVLQSAPVVSPEGEHATGAFTVTGLTSGALIRIINVPGYIPYTWFQATATIVTENSGGTITFRPGLLTGYTIERIGDAGFAAHGSTNMADDTALASPPNKILDFPCGQATRYGKCSALVATFVDTNGGSGGNAYLFVDGTLHATVPIASGGANRGINVALATDLDPTTEHRYTIGAPKGRLDSFVWSGGTGPSTTDVSTRHIFCIGNSIDAGDIAQDANGQCQQGSVYANLLAIANNAQLWNVAISGDTIGNMHTRFATDTANCPATMDVAFVGSGENDHALSGPAFTSALTTLINDVLTKWPSITKIIVRGEYGAGSGGATDATKQNAIAACNDPSRCVFVAFPVGFTNSPSGTMGGTDTVDGQHPAPQGYVKLANAWASEVSSSFNSAPIITLPTATASVAVGSTVPFISDIEFADADGDTMQVSVFKNDGDEQLEFVTPLPSGLVQGLDADYVVTSAPMTPANLQAAVRALRVRGMQRVSGTVTVTVNSDDGTDNSNQVTSTVTVLAGAAPRPPNGLQTGIHLGL